MRPISARALALLLLLADSADSMRVKPGAAPYRRNRAITASAAALSKIPEPLLAALAESGPVGVDTTEEQQDTIEKLASALDGQGADEAQANVPLKGTYDLLYSMAKGGSNGKVGPFVGAVTQIILDEKNFINQVSLFGGAVIVQLYAEREIIADDKIRVSFVETVFNIFGQEVKRQPTSGKGVWQQLYVERGADGSASLRVMRTPSLFVLRQRE